MTGYPVTPTQRDLYLHHLRHPGDTTYSLGVAADLPATVDPDRWATAVARVWSDEPLAAVAFAVRDGEVRQERVAAGPPPFEVVELPADPAAFARFVATRIKRPYRLDEAPLVSSFLCRGDGVATAVVAAPHLLLDGASGRVLFDRVAAVYRGAGNGRPAGPGFLERAEEIAARFDEPDTLAHWGTVGEGLTPLHLRTDGRREHDVARTREPAAETTLTADRAAALTERCAGRGLSLPAALLAVYAAAIGRLCEPAGPFAVHNVLGGRDARSADLLGCFYHVLPYVFDPTWRNLSPWLGSVPGYRRGLSRRQYISVQQQGRFLPRGSVSFYFNYYDFAIADLLGFRSRVLPLDSFPETEIHLLAHREPAGGIRLRLEGGPEHFSGTDLLARIVDLVDRFTAIGDAPLG